jgi:hypothetical protein
MAAGLPLIVSDWDGMKDTVTADVGIRVATEWPHSALTGYLGGRYFGGIDNYAQYTSQLSAVTRINMAEMTRALVTLGQDPALRARMGQAGRERARRIYDWSAVIPQMQALWAEQAAMLAYARKAEASAPIPAMRLPPAPAPGIYFAAYPSRQGAPAGRIWRARPRDDRPDLTATLDLRNYEGMRRLIENRERIAAMLAALDRAGEAGATALALAKAADVPERAALRILYWLMKYDFAE